MHLEGFVSPNPPIVIVIADTGRRVTLRVVPPDTDQASASQAMTAAAHHAVEPPTGATTTADAVERRSPPSTSATDRRVGQRGRRSVRQRKVQAFVSILVEHIVRGRLDAIRADPHTGSTD